MPARQPRQHLHGPRRLSRRRGSRSRVLVAAAVVLTLAQPADAGNYVVTQCSSVTPCVAGGAGSAARITTAQRALCGTDSGLQAFHDADATGLWQLRRLGLARAGRDRVHRRTGQREPHLPGRPPRRARRRPPGRRSWSAFGAEHNDFRVHSIHGEFTQFHAGCAASPRRRATVRPRRRDAAHAYVRGVYPANRGPGRRPRLTLTGGSLLDAEVIRGRARADLRRRRRRQRHPQGLSSRATASLLVTDVRNCAVAAGFATALQPCPAAHRRVRRGADRRLSLRHRARTTGQRPASRTWRSTAPRTASASSDSVWVDNACPSSAVGGGTAVSAGFGDGKARALGRVRPPRRACAGGSRAPGPARPSAR